MELMIFCFRIWFNVSELRGVTLTSCYCVHCFSNLYDDDDDDDTGKVFVQKADNRKWKELIPV